MARFASPSRSPRFSRLTARRGFGSSRRGSERGETSAGVVLAALLIVLALLPLTLSKPGVPTGFKADEAAYYLMAESLAHDRDLRFEQQDAARAFPEFGHRRTRNVILMSNDGWQNVFFGKPFIYPLVTAPFVFLFGANGMIWLNSVLFGLMILMGARYLTDRTRAPSSDFSASEIHRGRLSLLAVLFAIGFFMVSAIWPYVFWMHPEIFNAFCVTCFLYCTYRRPVDSPLALAMGAAGGVALGMAVYSKPMFAALILPSLVAPLLMRRFVRAVVPSAAMALSVLVLSVMSLGLTDVASAYMAPRQGFTLCSPDQPPLELAGLAAVPAGSSQPAAESPDAESTGPDAHTAEGNSWAWVLGVPDITPWLVLENFGYFLFGRHAGLLIYFPFVGVALLMWLLGWQMRTVSARHERESRAARLENLAMLLALLVIALFFLIRIHWNWQGGGGFVGNRYYVSVVPAFLFLIPRLGAVLTLLGYALGALLVAPLLITPLGSTVREGTLQAHTRNWPLRELPLELSLRNVPGYHRVPLGGVRAIARQDWVVPRGTTLWTRANAPVEILLVSDSLLTSLVFDVKSPVLGNRVRVKTGAEDFDLQFNDTLVHRIEVTGNPYQVRTQGSARQWIYRLEAHSSKGQVKTWERLFPPPSCENFAWYEGEVLDLYTGAEITWLGEREHVAAPVYSVEWVNAGAHDEDAPAEISQDLTAVAGATLSLPVTVRNTSGSDWQARGAAAVKLSYHLLDEAGQSVEFDGKRTNVGFVPAGGEASAMMEVPLPEDLKPGRYRLALDPVYERIGWFSQHGVAAFELPLIILPDEAAPLSVEGGSETAAGNSGLQ